MDLKEFIANFADQFDETEPEDIKADTAFRDLEEWSSLITLSVLNMIGKEYGYTMTFEELRTCVTVEDLYNLVATKI